MRTLFLNTLKSKGLNPTSFCIFSSPYHFCCLCLILNVNISSIIFFYRHTIFNLFSLYCALQILHFLKIEALRQLCIEKVYGHHLPNIFSLCISLSHFGNSCKTSNIFIVIICFVVICDQWTLILLLLWFWRAVTHTHIQWWTY